MKQFIISVLVLSNVVALAQTVPSGAGGTNAGSGWWRGGNTQGNGANIMATIWNSPIYTITRNNFNVQSYRMKINAVCKVERKC